ncbi:MAG: hypothetical protein FIA90_08215 [candidate division NC10 bacterium]|nr:hypothetical protein [candidate division NC10 bacterium]
MARWDEDKEAFIRNLIQVNLRAGVEPELVDLLAAYARIRLQQGDKVTFYSEDADLPGSRRKAVRALLEATRHLDPRALSFLSTYAEAMVQRGLIPILTRTHLAKLLEVSENELSDLATCTDRYYDVFSIPKANGQRRKIQAPRPPLKEIQQRIAALLERVKLHPDAHGFRGERSILTNARLHLDRQVVINLDVKDFFPSSTFERVLGCLGSLGYPHGVALLLTQLTTYHDVIPTGAPTSPILSNLICRRLDLRLSRLGDQLNFRYSRYADDMTISSEDGGIVRRLPFFKEIIREEGFEVHEEKIRVMRKGSRQQVTGVIVNEKPNLPRQELKKLRAVIHNCLTADLETQRIRWALTEKGLQDPDGFAMEAFRRSLCGRVSLARMVNPRAGVQLLDMLKRVEWRI